jgi:hypothetical protein
VREKALCQILGLVDPEPAPADERIERIPINAAKALQRGRRLGTACPAGKDDHTPLGGWKITAFGIHFF